MFQFAEFPSIPYVFRYGYINITLCGFPHSEILGSKLGQLSEAYRSCPRPSSASMPRDPPYALNILNQGGL